ncbi:MAG: Ig-like domain-containing protein, partial [Methanosarcinales archaeon]
VPDNTYALDLQNVVLKDEDNNNIPGVTVTDGEAEVDCGDVPPDPEITAPVDGAVVCGVVTVTVVDNSGEGDIEYCLIEYFNGTEWIEIVNDTSAPYGGDWDTSGLSPGDYTVRATMEDAAGQSGTDEITVTIPPCCDADFVLELEAGWNLVSVPARINGSKNAVDVFNLSGLDSCWYYDACTGNWSSNSDVSVEPCRGYWVLKENAETLCLDLNESAGPSDIPSQDLCEGWNMIGYTSSVAIDDGTAGDFKSVSTLEDTFAQLWTYSQTSGWLGYPSWGLDRLEPGEGAWILMTEDATMYGTPYV